MDWQVFPNSLCPVIVALALSTLVLGLAAIADFKWLPEQLKDMIKLGRSAQTTSPITRYFKYWHLPRSLYLHKYIFATFAFLATEWIIFKISVHHEQLPSLVVSVINGLAGADRTYSSILLANSMMLTHATIRWVETAKYFINDTTWNATQYALSFVYYSLVPLALVVEVPLTPDKTSVAIANTTLLNYFLGVSLFISFSIIQFKSHLTLSNLRRDKKGNVITLKHSIPTGDLFELVSSPHYLAEIVIYLSVSLVLSGRCITWWYISLFVMTNTLIFGVLNHQWYQKNFPNYPKQRKAVIPFLI